MKTLLAKHRSIRKFRSEPIAPEVLQDMLEAASRASTCGNMQLYSLIVTQSRELREALAPCHFNQPMVTQAPCVITVCADVHRFSMWCEQRDAEPCYDNFAWFLNGVTDALLAAQNLCVEAEAHGLGICYLGTTIYTAEEIARILDLPKGVIPVTTIVVGHPDESPELTDRLPLDAQTQEILGIPVRKVVFHVAPGRNLAVLLEVAVRNCILQLRGIDSMSEFINRQQQAVLDGNI